MSPEEESEVQVAHSIEEGVRGSVVRAIREKCPDAGEVRFHLIRSEGDAWTVEGSWAQPVAGGWGEVRTGRFEGTVKIVPGSTPGRKGFQLGVTITVPVSEYGISSGRFGSQPTGRSPNDQRSDVFNPTSSEHRAAADNRANQLNPQHPAYHRSRGKK
jgi:hypothetical protein